MDYWNYSEKLLESNNPYWWIIANHLSCILSDIILLLIENRYFWCPLKYQQFEFSNIGDFRRYTVVYTLSWEKNYKNHNPDWTYWISENSELKTLPQNFCEIRHFKWLKKWHDVKRKSYARVVYNGYEYFYLALIPLLISLTIYGFIWIICISTYGSAFNKFIV